MGHNHSYDNHDVKNIGIAFILNAVFVIIEVIGGVWTNSIAILSDALHDFGDCVSLVLAWVLQKKSKKKRDSKYSYGYKRFSLLGSVFLCGILTISSVYVMIKAIGRIVSPQEINAGGMLWIAVVGVLINGAAAFRLKKGHSLSERAVFLHIMEDVLGWVAVLVVSVVMMWVDVPILDPLLSVCISLWVLSNVYSNLRDTFRIFLQGVPENVDVEALKKDIEEIECVISVHDVHVWTLDGQDHIMTLHVVCAPKTDVLFLKKKIDEISIGYSIKHTTIECENIGMECHRCCNE
ncbi:MAG: cation diffusion facilitator family transporter [Flavobacteriales bacterium]|nr:cation diffusion facilitator family transporter [Flavobacteriales bacterium]